jgi:hypothetical protein
MIGACKKSSRFDCIKRTGNIEIEKRVLSDFNALEVYNNVSVFLIQDTSNFVDIKAGKNLIEGVETSVINQQLTIKNNNKCNFTRSYKNEIQIYVHFKVLNELIYRGTGPITSLNPIINDIFTLNSWDGADSVKLNLEVPIVYTNIHTGVADVIVQGHCNQLFAYAKSSGAFRMQNFICNNVYTNNLSSSDQYFFVQNKLEALVQYVGNTYYQGNPKQIIQTINNKGKLIKND